MGRFSNLEFGREEDSSERKEPEAIRDEKFYLSAAQEKLRDGRFENALRFYSRALEFDAHLPEAWLGQVLSLLELEEPHEARVWADKGLEAFPNHPEMLAAKGVAFSRLGDLDKAMGLSDAALAEKGSSAYRWRARGEVLLARDDRNEDFCFGKAMAAAQGDWFEPLAIGRVYLRYDRAAAGLRYLEAAASRHSGSAWLWETLGLAQERAGMGDRARRSYQNALDIDREREGAKAGLARVDAGAGSFLRRLVSWFRG